MCKDVRNGCNRVCRGIICKEDVCLSVRGCKTVREMCKGESICVRVCCVCEKV